MQKSKELRQQRKELLDKNDAILGLIELEKRDMNPDEKVKFDSYTTQIQGLKGDIEREERKEAFELAKFEAALQVKPQVPLEARVEIVDRAMPGLRGSNEYRGAFLDYCRFGQRGIKPEQALLLENEIRAQGVGSGSIGGYLVPEGFQNELDKAVNTFGGMRAVARILSTGSGNDIPWPTVNDTSNTGSLIAENIQVTDLDVAIGQVILKAYKYSSRKVPVSIELLQDAAINVESELAQLLGERIARIQNTHFTTGDNSGKPQGVVPASTKGVDAADDATVTYEELVDLVHSVDPAYRPGARFMLNDTSLAAVMKLKDSYGHFYFQPDSRGGESTTILGYPYTVNQDVADIAASAKAILFGNFQKYIIREVLGFTLLRLDQTKADYGQVEFIAFARADGRLLNAGTNPIKHILQHDD